MSTASSALAVGGLEVEIVQKDIKNLHIGVYPPAGRVRVAAPAHLDEDRIRLAVVQRLAWVKRQRRNLQAAERLSEREMLSGESHYVWGRRYRLQLVETMDDPGVELDGGKLLMRVAPSTDAVGRAKLLRSWERRQLRQRLPELIEKWEPALGCQVPAWGIRRMKTKWGTCSRGTGRLWFNLELVKEDPRALEYIVVHEMAHLLEASHGERFTQTLDERLPDWRARRDELNGAPLSEEQWAA